MIKKILFIPSLCGLIPGSRLLEIGRLLSKKYDIYMLQWEDTHCAGFLKKAIVALTDIFKTPAIYEQKGVLAARYPFSRFPFFMSGSYNASSLEKFITGYKINVVINQGNRFFPTPFSKNYRHIFDLESLPSQGDYEFIRREVQKADAVCASSQSLVDYAAKHFNRKAYFVPAGFYPADFSGVDFNEVKKIREGYGLLNKFVLGYIGDDIAGLDTDFMRDFFLQMKKKNNNIVLMVISREVFKKQVQEKDFIIVSGIPKEKLPDYFFALNAGILPVKKTPSSDVCFYPNIIEYTAAKKLVIVSSLAETSRLNFPNVITADLNVKDWLAAVERARSTRWDEEWNSLAFGYDWKNSAEKLAKVIEGV